MTVSMDPEAILSPLPRSDGSATYSYGGYAVTASVNGPIEAQRRDEDPYQSVVDVVVRPAAGVGGTRERHLEAIIQASLKQLILVKNFPRCLIQVVLQITASPENDYVNAKLVQASLNLPIVPALLQAAALALLSAAIPLRATATSTAIAVIREGSAKKLVTDPAPSDVEMAESVHVLAFTSHEELLLVESEGDFTMKDWDEVHNAAKSICCDRGEKSGIDMVLDDEEPKGPDMGRFLRSTVEAKITSDLRWK